MTSLLFSADGRLNRARFWLAVLGSSFGLSALLGLTLFALWQVLPGEITEDGVFRMDGVAALPYVALIMGWLVLQLWISICLGIKRYHDMDKPGSRMLILLIPAIGGLIYVIQAGFLRGTTGANSYGADPRPTGAAA